MKYKIVKKAYRNIEHKIITEYYVMKWVRKKKKWYESEYRYQWDYVEEYTYLSIYRPKEPIARSSIKAAEKVINDLCKKIPEPKDIKIIICNQL